MDKAEGAQQLRNVAQNEFRQSLSDLSKLMWTRQEGMASVESGNREIGVMIANMERRTALLEASYSNLQGRMWAVNAIWAVFVVAMTVGVRFLGH